MTILCISQRSKDIIKLYRTERMEAAVESYLENILKQHPDDIDALLRLAIVNSDIPFVDYNRAEEIINKVFEIDQYHVKAWILFMYWRKLHPVFTNEENEIHIFTHLKTTSSDEQAMIYYLLSAYYDFKELYEQKIFFLKKSTELSAQYVWNHRELALFYEKSNNIQQAKYHYEKALNNVQKVYTDNELNNIDFSDPEEYLSEHIKGIHTTENFIVTFKKSLDEINQKLQEQT